MADHPDREQLAAFQAGDGDRRQRSGVEAHLAGCRSCAEVVASVERARSDLALLEEPALPPAARPPGHRPWRRGLPGPRGPAWPARPRRSCARPLVPPAGRPGAAAALLLAALVVPFLDQSGTMPSTDRAAGGAVSREGQTEAGVGATARLPVIQIPGEVTAAKIDAQLAGDSQAKAALDAAASGGTPPPRPRPRRARPRSTAPARTPPVRPPRPPRAPRPPGGHRPARLPPPRRRRIADPAARPLPPAVEGTYQGREATILVTTGASPQASRPLGLPRNNCSAPPRTPNGSGRGGSGAPRGSVRARGCVPPAPMPARPGPAPRSSVDLWLSGRTCARRRLCISGDKGCA